MATRRKKHTNIWKPSKDEANKLAHACVEALMGEDRQPSICLVLGSSVTLPKGFPRGIATERSSDRIVRKILASKVLDWLYDKRYVTFSSQHVRSTNWGMSMLIGKIVKGSLDLEQDIGVE